MECPCECQAPGGIGEKGPVDATALVRNARVILTSDDAARVVGLREFGPLTPTVGPGPQRLDSPYRVRSATRQAISAPTAMTSNATARRRCVVPREDSGKPR